jgi:alpha-N-arabinofuranosidase
MNSQQVTRDSRNILNSDQQYQKYRYSDSALLQSAHTEEIFSSRASVQITQPEHFIYKDELTNGWMDYGWANRNYANTSTVYAGSNSIKVSASAWEGIHLNHGVFDAAKFTAISFCINGGSSDVQYLALGPILSHGEGKEIMLPTVASNQWQQFTISFEQLGIAGIDNVTGFYFADKSGVSRTYYLDEIGLIPAPLPSKITVNIDTLQTIKNISTNTIGVNNGVWESSYKSPENIEILKELGSSVLRYPGGSISDEYNWKTNQSTRNGVTTNWALNFDEFAAGVLQTGSQAFITVNYGSGTPQLAADWVDYANNQKKYGIKFWEIGNECYDSREYDLNSRAHDPYIYAQRASEYITLMKSKDPTIKVGVVIVGNDKDCANYKDRIATNPRTGEKTSAWTPVVLSTLNQLNTIPDFVTYPKYINAPGYENDELLLQAGKSWNSDIRAIRQTLNDYLGRNASDVKIVATEHNSLWTTPNGKQSTNLINGLFYLDSAGNALGTELDSLVWWTLRSSKETNGNLDTNLYGWRNFGGFGMIGPDYSNPEKFPTFYAAKLFNKFREDGQSMVASESNTSLLSSFAIRRSDRRLSILLVNKSPSTSLNPVLSIEGFNADTTATSFTYGMTQDEAARLGSSNSDVIQKRILIEGGGSFSISVPPYTGVVLVLDPQTTTVTPAGLADVTA